MAERFAAHLKDLCGPSVEKRWSKDTRYRILVIRMQALHIFSNFSKFIIFIVNDKLHVRNSIKVKSMNFCSSGVTVNNLCRHQKIHSKENKVFVRLKRKKQVNVEITKQKIKRKVRFFVAMEKGFLHMLVVKSGIS